MKISALISAVLYQFREQKSIHHHRGDPPFFLFPGLRLYGVYPSFRTYGVYPFPLFSQENGIHHSFFALWPRGRVTDREKRGPAVVVYTLFSLAIRGIWPPISEGKGIEPPARPPRTILAEWPRVGDGRRKGCHLHVRICSILSDVARPDPTWEQIGRIAHFPIIGQAIRKVSPCRKRSPAKEVWQTSDKSGGPEKVTKRGQKKWPKSDRTPFADLLLRHPEGRLSLTIRKVVWGLLRRYSGLSLGLQSKVLSPQRASSSRIECQCQCHTIAQPTRASRAWARWSTSTMSSFRITSSGSRQTLQVEECSLLSMEPKWSCVVCLCDSERIPQNRYCRNKVEFLVDP